MASYGDFLRRKLQGYSLGLVLRLEAESFLLGILSIVPTTFGVLLRGLAAKLFFKSLGGFPWIQPRVIIIHSERITAGRQLGVNSGCYINGIGEVVFGSNVLLGANVTISSGRHPIAGTEPAVFERPSIPQKIVFEDDVWVGAGAVIMPGVTLARGTVIGANAVVTRDTEEYSINVGIPARKVGDRRQRPAD